MELLKVMPGAERSLRETLRWATRESHARLDAAFVDILDPSRTGLYDVFVRMNHACHEEIEPILERSALRDFLPRPGERRQALREDMAALGLAPLEPRRFAIEVPNLHEAAGMAYVLEGSRLGATLILRRLDEAAATGRGDRSRRYLATSARAGEFRILMDKLSTLEWSERALNEASRAAVLTFGHFAHAAERAGACA